MPWPSSYETVLSPDGREWKVGVRWLPRPPRWVGWKRLGRGVDAVGHGIELAGAFGDLAPVAAILFAIVVVAAIWLLLIPIAVLLLDLAFIMLLVVLGVAVRVLFRRPWTVEAVHDEQRIEWSVVGWRASRRSVAEVVQAVELGHRMEAAAPPPSARLPASVAEPGPLHD